jgi:hypothetical protein
MSAAKTQTKDSMASADPGIAALVGKLFATVPETAAVLRSDQRSVRRAIAAGEIPSTRVGPRSLVPTAWLRHAAGLFVPALSGAGGQHAPAATRLLPPKDVMPMLTDPADIGRLLEQSDERDQHSDLRREAERQAYRAGYVDGFRAAVGAGDRVWRDAPSPQPIDGTALAELEQKRWGPGGRSRFADPRPGDYRPTDISGHDAMRSA